MKMCTCMALGRHDPECYWVGKPSGGQFHCRLCGAEPKWETVEHDFDSPAGTCGPAINVLVTRYCDEHRPEAAVRIAEETWRDRPALL